MLKELIQSLNKAKAEVQALEATVEKQLKASLATIHADHGFDSVESFIRAVKKASAEVEAKGRKAAERAVPKAKRARITAAVRATVKNLVKAGRSGAVIAREVGISTASVQNIKKALGLVNSGKKRAAQPPKSKKRSAPGARKRQTAPKAPKRRSTERTQVPAPPAPAAPEPVEASAPASS
jgi:hypothetical protein